VATTGILASPAFDWFAGIGHDSAFWLRHQVFDQKHNPAESPTVVIAIDEETYRAPGFANVPKALWTKEIATVIEAALDAGATVIGMDMIFPTSAEHRLPGYDRNFLLALKRGAKDNRVVLAKVQHQVKPIEPHPGQRFAVDHGKNIRATNLPLDRDGVIRKVHPFFPRKDDGKMESAFSTEIAARAMGALPTQAPDGSLILAGRVVPGTAGNSLTLNFDGGDGVIPTYSLADIHACAEAGNTEYLKNAFAGRVVLIGAVLDVEDRKLTTKRFMTRPDGQALPERCVREIDTSLYRDDLRRSSLPGVYIHATAINDLLRGDTMTTPSRLTRALMTLALSLMVIVPALFLPLRFGLPVLITLILGWGAGSTVAVRYGYLLPLQDPPAAMIVVFAGSLGIRLAVSDRDKRALRKAFGLYLPGALIERMIDSGKPPVLGGERREVTIFFSDIAGFTSISEDLTPEELVSWLNRYLSAMTDIVEAHGGMVDKYIGDAVVAVFGAPVSDPDHAANACRAALASQALLANEGAQFAARPGSPMSARIGVNSGEVLIGNIGSERRFNYTAMGDVVNVAARLEGANKAFGTGILAGPRTAELAGASISFREIDQLRVIGREAPLVVFEPLAAPPSNIHERYAEALAHLHAGRFADAVADFATTADSDPAASAQKERAATLDAAPPTDWQGVLDLTRK